MLEVPRFGATQMQLHLLRFPVQQYKSEILVENAKLSNAPPNFSVPAYTDSLPLFPCVSMFILVLDFWVFSALFLSNFFFYPFHPFGLMPFLEIVEGEFPQFVLSTFFPSP